MARCDHIPQQFVQCVTSPATAAISTWQVRIRSSANLPERNPVSFLVNNPTRCPRVSCAGPPKFQANQQFASNRLHPDPGATIGGSNDNHLVVENYGPPLFIVPCTSRYIYKVSLSNHIFLWQPRDTVIYVSLYRFVRGWPGTLINSEIKNVGRNFVFSFKTSIIIIKFFKRVSKLPDLLIERKKYDSIILSQLTLSHMTKYSAIYKTRLLKSSHILKSSN